ncbi:MAG: hypothetical protein ACRCWI_01270 [Brevinema sp.]
MKKIVFFTLFFPILLFAQGRTVVQESQIINDLLTKDINTLVFQSPLVLSNMILFFYRGSAKSVQLAGDFNNWQALSMEESRSNLWVLSLKTRIPQGKYRYRLKVDGFWITDPMNPDFEYDQGRQKLSLLSLNNDFIPNKKFPLWVSNNTYLFQHYNTNANIVTIAGDFNNWNPFSHQLQYKGAGIFEIELKLDPKKIYLYSFVQDGIWVADPNNKKQFLNDLQRLVSGFYANQTNSIP